MILSRKANDDITYTFSLTDGTLSAKNTNYVPQTFGALQYSGYTYTFCGAGERDKSRGYAPLMTG